MGHPVGGSKTTKTRGLYKTYITHGGDIDRHMRNKNFETVVANALNLENVIFCFICLGVGLIVSLSIATMEYMSKIFKAPLIKHDALAQLGQ